MCVRGCWRGVCALLSGIRQQQPPHIATPNLLSMTRAKKTKKGAGSILLSRHRGLNNDGRSVVALRSASINSTSSLSSKAGRTLIRKHHTLQKRLSQAVAKNDSETAGSIRAEIEAYGGLEKYQQASVRFIFFIFFPSVLFF